MLVLDAEDGADYTFGRKTYWRNVNEAPPVADGTWDICIVDVRGLTTLQKVLPWLQRGKHDFVAVDLDSLSEIQKRIVDEIAGTNQMRPQDWGELFRRGEALVRAFRDLKYNPVKPLTCVVFVAGTIERVTVSPGKKKIAEEDRELKLKPYVQGQLGHTLPGFVDLIGFIEVMDDDTHLLRVRPKPGFIAKDRFHTFREGVVDITYDDERGWPNTLESMQQRITETLDARAKGGSA